MTTTELSDDVRQCWLPVRFISLITIGMADSQKDTNPDKMHAFTRSIAGIRLDRDRQGDTADKLTIRRDTDD